MMVSPAIESYRQLFSNPLTPASWTQENDDIEIAVIHSYLLHSQGQLIACASF